MSTTYEFDTHPAAYPADWERAWVQRVVDGDTYYLRVDLGFHVAMTIPLRLLGVDAPELSTPEGKLVRDQLRLMLEGQPVLVRTKKDSQSFARWLGDVLYYDHTIAALYPWFDLAELMVARGWAVPMAR